MFQADQTVVMLRMPDAQGIQAAFAVAAQSSVEINLCIVRIVIYKGLS